MIDFYNAFISYKHAKLDTSVAEHIQKKLEHFHVPHKLKKGLRHQKITRIFRDKDELPITSDLTETITDALRKAEFLIVICSTNTKESIWVKREINTFLQTHSRDNVLTVLCDGEPNEVIPEELLSTEKEFMDASGYIQKIRVPVEPLSCDYRMSRRRADREELPRLASVILGCSYDELQRRRRQYAIRRAAAIIAVAFAGMAAFGAYMSYSRQQIDKSYVESLRSRSMYLANESSQLLKDDKRTDSVQLALAALPSSPDDKMPVTATAIRAITDATAAYKSNSGLNYKPIWNFKTEQPITKFMTSENKERLAAMDKAGNLYCWNVLTHELLFQKYGDNDPQEIFFLGNDSLLMIYRNHMEAYNIDEGQMIWEFDDTTAVLGAKKVFYAVNSVFVDSGNGTVIRLSAKDGSVKDTYDLVTDSVLKSINDLAVSSDGRKIAYTENAISTGDSVIVHIFDVETRTDCSNSINCYYISNIEFIDNDHLCVISNDDAFFSSVQFSDEYSLLREGTLSFHCFDAKMQNLWVSTIEYNNVARCVGLLYLPSREAVVYSVGNAAAIVDINTGTTVNQYMTGSSILSVTDWNDNGLPEFICTQGEYLFATSTEENTMICFDVLGTSINLGEGGEFIYTVQENDNNVICYGRRLQDDEWEAVSGFSNASLGSDYQACYADEDYLIIAATINNSTGVRVSIIDAHKGKLLSITDIPDNNYLISHYEIDRVGDNYYGFFGTDIYTIDPEDGKVEKYDMEIDSLDSLSNGKIISRDIKDDTLTVEVTDVDDNSTQTITLEDIEDADRYMLGDCVYDKTLNKVFVPMGNRIFAADLKSEDIEELTMPDTWNNTRNYTLSVVTSADGSQIVFSDGITIYVTDGSFKEMYTLRCRGGHRFGAAFRNGILFIAEDYFLSLYKAGTGEFIGKYEMTLYGIGISDITFDDRNQQLYVQTGGQISIFDMNTWTEIAYIENVYCYNEENDRFYVYSFIDDSDTTPGYIKHYTVEDLIEKAKRFLNGLELDDVTKSKYGLG